MKRHTLEVPPDAPPCCPTRTGSSSGSSQNTEHISHSSSDGADLLNQYTNDNNPDFDISHQGNDDAMQSYSFPSLNDDDLFHPFEADVPSRTVDTNIINQYFPPGSLDSEPNMDTSSTDLDHDYSLDNYDFQMTDAVPYTTTTEPNHESSTPTTSHPPAHRNHHHRPSGAQWPTPFLIPTATMPHPPQQKQSPDLQSPDSQSNPSTPSWQTTIRFSGADPTTVSNVISALSKSRAKFIYETH